MCKWHCLGGARFYESRLTQAVPIETGGNNEANFNHHVNDIAGGGDGQHLPGGCADKLQLRRSRRREFAEFSNRPCNMRRNRTPGCRDMQLQRHRRRWNIDVQFVIRGAAPAPLRGGIVFVSSQSERYKNLGGVSGQCLRFCPTQELLGSRIARQINSFPPHFVGQV